MWRTTLFEHCEEPCAGSPEPSCDAGPETLPGVRRSLLQRGALAALQTYKLAISPLLPPACKFYPTCSDYAREAVEGHGLPRGAWLAAKRLLRCRPFSKGGFDPVPGTRGPADA